MFYWVKTPNWVSKIWPSLVWQMPANRGDVYISFDDGPHPTVTPWVLKTLENYQAKASFFCIGDNVIKYPSVFQQVLAAGHTIGNHTYRHYNAWHVSKQQYVKDIQEAEILINSELFRPPYGKISPWLANSILRQTNVKKIVMWTVLSADFDTEISSEQVVNNVMNNVQPGSIIVFHDSEKAFPHLQKALPALLQHCQKMDWICKAL